MERILQIALDAEQKACNIIAEAQAEKERCDKAIAQADSVSEKYMKRARESVAEFEKSQEQKAHEISQELDTELSCSMQKLTERYEQDCAQWVDTMYREIVENI